MNADGEEENLEDLSARVILERLRRGSKVNNEEVLRWKDEYSMIGYDQEKHAACNLVKSLAERVQREIQSVRGIYYSEGPNGERLLQ